MFIEKWKDILGFEGHYQVSNLGRVKSLERVIIKSNGVKMPVREKILTVFRNPKGYCIVCLAKNNSKFPFQVHRIVAEAFLGESELQVNHKFPDKTKNEVSNLEYVSSLENCNHRERVVKNKKQYGITFEKQKQLWLAQIVVNGKNIKLGRSKDKESAYRRFYNAYVEHYGVTPW